MATTEGNQSPGSASPPMGSMDATPRNLSPSPLSAVRPLPGSRMDNASIWTRRSGFVPSIMHQGHIFRDITLWLPHNEIPAGSHCYADLFVPSARNYLLENYPSALPMACLRKLVANNLPFIAVSSFAVLGTQRPDVAHISALGNTYPILAIFDERMTFANVWMGSKATSIPYKKKGAAYTPPALRRKACRGRAKRRVPSTTPKTLRVGHGQPNNSKPRSGKGLPRPSIPQRRRKSTAKCTSSGLSVVDKSRQFSETYEYGCKSRLYKSRPMQTYGKKMAKKIHATKADLSPQESLSGPARANQTRYPAAKCLPARTSLKSVGPLKPVTVPVAISRPSTLVDAAFSRTACDIFDDFIDDMQATTSGNQSSKCPSAEVADQMLAEIERAAEPVEIVGVAEETIDVINEIVDDTNQTINDVSATAGVVTSECSPSDSETESPAPATPVEDAEEPTIKNEKQPSLDSFGESNPWAAAQSSLDAWTSEFTGKTSKDFKPKEVKPVARKGMAFCKKCKKEVEDYMINPRTKACDGGCAVSANSQAWRDINYLRYQHRKGFYNRQQLETAIEEVHQRNRGKQGYDRAKAMGKSDPGPGSALSFDSSEAGSRETTPPLGIQPQSVFPRLAPHMSGDASDIAVRQRGYCWLALFDPRVHFSLSSTNQPLMKLSELRALKELSHPLWSGKLDYEITLVGSTSIIHLFKVGPEEAGFSVLEIFEREEWANSFTYFGMQSAEVTSQTCLSLAQPSAGRAFNYSSAPPKPFPPQTILPSPFWTEEAWDDDEHYGFLSHPAMTKVQRRSKLLGKITGVQLPAFENPLQSLVDRTIAQPEIRHGKARVVLIEAACGVGKSIMIPQLVQRNGRQLVMCIPTISAVRSAYSFLTKQTTLKIAARAGKQNLGPVAPVSADVMIYTTGALTQAILRDRQFLNPEKTILYIDEAHKETADARILSRLISEMPWTVVLSSATLAGRLFAMEKAVAQTWIITEHTPAQHGTTKMSNKNRPLAAQEIASWYPDSRDILVIGPTVKVAAEFAEHLPGTIVEVSSRGLLHARPGRNPIKMQDLSTESLDNMRSMLSGRIIWAATNAIEVGVTFKNLDIVIDLGMRMYDSLDFAKFDPENPDIQEALQPVYRPATKGEIVQGAGRVSRLSAGVAILCNGPHWSDEEPHSCEEDVLEATMLHQLGRGIPSHLYDLLSTVDPRPALPVLNRMARAAVSARGRQEIAARKRELEAKINDFSSRYYVETISIECEDGSYRTEDKVTSICDPPVALPANISDLVKEYKNARAEDASLYYPSRREVAQLESAANYATQLSKLRGLLFTDKLSWDDTRISLADLSSCFDDIARHDMNALVYFLGGEEDELKSVEVTSPVSAKASPPQISATTQNANSGPTGRPVEAISVPVEDTPPEPTLAETMQYPGQVTATKEFIYDGVEILDAAAHEGCQHCGAQSEYNEEWIEARELWGLLDHFTSQPLWTWLLIRECHLTVQKKTLISQLVNKPRRFHAQLMKQVPGCPLRQADRKHRPAMEAFFGSWSDQALLDLIHRVLALVASSTEVSRVSTKTPSGPCKRTGYIKRMRSPGYCYLRWFKASRHDDLASNLQRNPTVAQILEARPDFACRGVLYQGKSAEDVVHVHARPWEPLVPLRSLKSFVTVGSNEEADIQSAYQVFEEKLAEISPLISAEDVNYLRHAMVYMANAADQERTVKRRALRSLNAIYSLHDQPAPYPEYEERALPIPDMHIPSKQMTVEEARKWCRHEVPVTQEDYRRYCGCNHAMYADQVACMSHVVATGVKDMSGAWQPRENQPATRIPVSTAEEAYSELVPKDFQVTIDWNKSLPPAPLSTVVQLLSGKHVVPNAAKSFIDSQPATGYYTIQEVKDKEGKIRAFDVTLVAETVISGVMYNGLAIAPASWMAACRQYAYKIYREQRELMSLLHAPGLECAKSCGHHDIKGGIPTASQRRACRQVCRHEHNHFAYALDHRGEPDKTKPIPNSCRQVCGHGHKDFASTLTCLSSLSDKDIGKAFSQLDNIPVQVQILMNMRAKDDPAMASFLSADKKIEDQLREKLATLENEYSTVVSTSKKQAEDSTTIIKSLREEISSHKCPTVSRPVVTTPPLLSRTAKAKASIRAWHAESFKGPRDSHSVSAIEHLSTCLTDAPPEAKVLPPPNRIFKPSILSRWWNNVNTAIEISGKTFGYHSAEKTYVVQDEKQLQTWDPAARAEPKAKSYVATWQTLAYAYDHLKNPKINKPLFLEQLKISEHVLRLRAQAVSALPYAAMSRRTFIRKWDRATTAPSDPGPPAIFPVHPDECLNERTAPAGTDMWDLDNQRPKGFSTSSFSWRTATHDLPPGTEFNFEMPDLDRPPLPISHVDPDWIPTYRTVKAISLHGRYQHKCGAMMHKRDTRVWCDPVMIEDNGVTMQHPLTGYRTQETTAGLRCRRHFGHEIHDLNTDLCNAILADPHPSDEFMKFISPTIDAVTALLGTLKPTDIVWVTASSGSYNRPLEVPNWTDFTHAIIFSDTPITGLAATDQRVSNFIVPPYANSRFFGTLRSLPAFLPGNRARMVFSNAHRDPIPRPEMESILACNLDNFSHIQYTHIPVNLNSWYVRSGALTSDLDLYLAVLEVLSPTYGPDEWLLPLTRDYHALYTHREGFTRAYTNWGYLPKHFAPRKPVPCVLWDERLATTKMTFWFKNRVQSSKIICQLWFGRHGLCPCSQPDTEEKIILPPIKVPQLSVNELLDRLSAAALASIDNNFKPPKMKIENARGLPYAGFSVSLHAHEVTKYRFPGASGLHHTQFPEIPAFARPQMGHFINTLTRLCEGRDVVVTASATAPPPRKNRVNINFGTAHPAWINVPYFESVPGRSFATLRLAVLYAKPRSVWILNGRDLAEQKEPRLIKGRLHSFNVWNALPIILASAKTDIQLPRCEDENYETHGSTCLCSFDSGMRVFASTYGFDEHFLHMLPLTVSHNRELTSWDYRTLPKDFTFPCVQRFVRGKLVYEGPLSRIELLNGWQEMATTGKQLDVLDRASNKALDATLVLENLHYLPSPFAEPPTVKKDTLLIVIFGSRGDIVPIEYLARAMQKSGVPVVLWKAGSLTTQDFQDLKRSSSSKAMWGFLCTLGVTQLGYKAVMTPQAKLSPHAIKYTLTAWDTVEMPSFIGNPIAAMSAYFAKSMRKEIVIGATPSCNTPRSADGFNRLYITEGKKSREPAAWVEASDGIDAIPESIRSAWPAIRIPYDPSVFENYHTIYCSGTQGTVDTIISYGATPVITDAWFDQARNVKLVPRNAHEPTWHALGSALKAHGFQTSLPGNKWKYWIENLAVRSASHRFLKTFSTLAAFAPWFVRLAPVLGTWPQLLDFRFFALFPTLKTFYNVPLLWWLSPYSLGIVLTLWMFLEQLAFLALGRAEGVYLRLSVDRSWMPLKHAVLLDKNKNEMLEYGWYGARNLLAPFQARRWKKIQDPTDDVWKTIEIPVPISFDVACKLAEDETSKYGPFFNCQSQMLNKVGNSAPAITLLLLGLSYACLFVLAPWCLIMLAYRLDIKIFGKRPIELITLGPTVDDSANVNIMLASSLDDEEEEEDNKSPNLESESEDVVTTLQPSQAHSRDDFLQSSDEQQALEAIRYAVTAIPEGEVVPEDLVKEEAVLAWKAVLDTQQEDWDREIYKPIENDSFEAWVEDFFAWALNEIRAHSANVPIIKDFVRFLLACKDNIENVIHPVLSAMRAIFITLLETSEAAVKALTKLCSRLVDLAFGRQVTRKLKAAWFGAELLKANPLSIQHQIRRNLATANFYMEPDFDKQYAKDVKDLRTQYDEKNVSWDKLKQLQFDGVPGHEQRYAHIGKKGLGGPTWKPLALPRSLVISQQELDVLMEQAQKEGVDFNARVDEFFTKRVSRLMSHGTELATDGALLAAIRPSQAEASLLRYTHLGLEPNAALRTGMQPIPVERKERMDVIAQAYYEASPELFTSPKLTPPEAMLEWWKHRGMTKFNTTAPLNMSSRAHAIADGQLKAIIDDVYAKEKAGQYPNQYYGAKVKQQAVPVRPLVTQKADGSYKPVRTFTAQDSRSTAADWTVGLELKNRIPGHGESSKMAAGQGYSPLFRRIRGKENIYMGDMSQFDSRFEREHFYMLDKVLELGIDDKVVLSWLKAKHEAMQNSYIAVLQLPRDKPLSEFLQHARASNPSGPKALTGYENWILKIRSGATGESSTNWTDSKIFRLVFAAIVWDYCDYFRIPFHPRDLLNDQDDAYLINSGDDNMGHLDFLKKHNHVLNPLVMTAVARNWNMQLDFAVLDSFDECEFLGCMAREPTAADLKTLDRVRALFAAVNKTIPKCSSNDSISPEKRTDLIQYARINPELNDPTTKEHPDIIIYRNLENSLVRQTATTMYGNVHRNEVYLEKWLAKFVGHIQLCAFRPTYHQDIMMEYVQTACRYLYAASPNCRRDAAGIVMMPQGEDYDKIMLLLNLQHEDVNKRMVYAKPLSKAPSDSFYTTEMRRRLLRLSQQPPAAYSKVIGIHMAYGRKPASYYERKMNKILSGLYPVDEAAKELLDVLRSAIGEASRKLVKGFQPQARDQMYLEDIYDSGHYKVESAIWLTWEEKVYAEALKADPENAQLPEMTLPIWQGLCSKAAFGSITDPLRYYALMQDKEFNDRIHEYPAYVYRNLMWCLVFSYVMLWRLEVMIYKVPILGLMYALFMFMVIDMSKIYGLLSMVYWLEYMDVHPVISSWMPRDPYVLAKRLSSYQLKFIPMWLAAIMPFAGTGGLVGQGCAWFAQFFNRAQSIKPLAGHGIPINQPWNSDAIQMLNLLADPVKTPDNAIILNSATGTGKSSLGTDAITRHVRHHINPRSRTWVFVPTRILLKDPMPAFLGRGEDSSPEHMKTYQVLRRGVTIRANAEILFMTYGHGRNRLLSGEFEKGVDTAFVDEMHMLSAEQRLVVHELKGERIIFSSATTVPPPGFVAPTYRAQQRKKWKAMTRVFPATTNVASMFQRAHNDTQPVMGMVHSPAELSKRTLILCATFKEIDEVAESLITLRKSMFGAGIGVTLPPVVEVSSRIKPGTTDWTVRQKAFEKGEYIALGTKQAATGMDIKPNPPWLLIDGGEDIYSHEGTIIKLPTTPRDHEQRIGRVTRNSSDRDGLVYCREQAGTRGWDTLEYPSVAYCVEPVIANAYNLPQLLPVDQPAIDHWPYFSIKQEYEVHVKEALMFVVLASASGVTPQQLKSFYFRHWQNQIPLSDDYEWMDTLLKRQGRRSVISAPAWVTLETILGQDPVGWNTSRVRGSVQTDNLSWKNLLYPVAGQYHSFEEMSSNSSRRIIDSSSKENRAEDIAADLITRLQQALERSDRHIRDLQKNPKSEKNKPTLAEVQRREAQKRLISAVTALLEGRKPHQYRPQAQEVLDRFQTREREPSAPYIGEDLSSSLNPSEGWGYCSHDGCAAIIGESGPHLSVTPVLACGHHAAAAGDHVISPSFIVVKRGTNWTATYATTNDELIRRRILSSIPDDIITQVLDQMNRPSSEVTSKQGKNQKDHKPSSSTQPSSEVTSKKGKGKNRRPNK
nr:polyprotein [Rhizoctonia solani hypovirus 4]